MRLTLASQSPRRRELLRLLGIDPEVRPARADEALRPGETAEDYVRRVAAAKADSVEGEVVLGADTAVVLGGAVLGKPAGAEEARGMLRALSGRAHRVLTAVCLRRGARRAEVLVSSEVLFAVLDEALIDWYLAGGEPLDKAGAYALQGQGGALVREVRGSVSSVVGLPLHETAALLREIGFPLAWESR
ncbi:MAG TPA: Maf family protein [Anaeromyxobacteraceae bacterium]|jgi:septum formation protein